MTKPTMNEFAAHVQQTLEVQLEWARHEFILPTLQTRLQIWDKESGSLGHLKTNRKNKLFAGYTLKVQSYFFLREDVLATAEYSSYCWMPEVGMFKTSDWKLAADTLVAHELAHLVQAELKRQGSLHPWYVARPGTPGTFFDTVGRYESGHGLFFRNIYRRFRRHFINDRVEGQIGISRAVSFTHTDNFEERLAAMPKTGLEGLVAEFKGIRYTVVGRNPNVRQKLYRFQLQNASGKFFKCSLMQLVLGSPEIKAVVMSNMALAGEFLENEKAMKTKRVANAKSSMTKKIRNGSARLVRLAA